MKHHYLFQAVLFGALSLIGLLSPAQLAPGISFDLMHTSPTCSHEGYQPTFCHRDPDQTAMTAKAGMVERINAQLTRALKNPQSAKVYLAYFSFSNSGVQSKICELLKAGVKVRIVLDNGSQQNLVDLKNRTQCQGANFENLQVSFLGGLTSKPWRLHHNKFLFVDPGPGENVNLNFSSGNLSSFGTSLHMDHWVTMESPKDSNLVKAYRCVMLGLDAATAKAEASGGHSASNDSDIVATNINTREKCNTGSGVIPANQVDLAISKEGIAPFFSPNYDNVVFRNLRREIKKLALQKSGYIYIAIQHFLHSGTADELVAASNAGVDVRIVMDDDVVTEKGEVKGVLKFLKEMLSRAPRMKVRYAETNHNAGGNGSMMHNKFAIFNGQRVMSGAGHFTGAAMNDNWENFAITQVPSLTKKYAQYFKEIWDLSVDEDYVRAQLPYNEDYTKTHTQPSIKASEPLDPKFLNLIEEPQP